MEETIAWKKIPTPILKMITEFNDCYGIYLKKSVLTHDLKTNFKRLKGYYDHSFEDITDVPETWHLHDPTKSNSDISGICLMFGNDVMKMLQWCTFCDDIQYSRYLGCCYARSRSDLLT